jgi:hypothetical protein
MLGFTPLASAPLADSGVDKVSNLTFNDITTTPVVDSAPVAEGEQFLFNDIVTGAPVIDAIGTPVASNFVANDIVSGAPVVDSIGIVLVHVLAANDITSTPVVDNATAAFTDVLSATSLGPEVTNYTVTVADNGGNKFYIDGVSNPTLSLVRGQKYVFDVSDATNDGHPLVFTLSDGTTSYTDGVTSVGTSGTSGATVTFLVPSDAPASLRYVCSVHGSGMGNTISVSSQALDLQPTIDTATVSVISNFAPVDIFASAPQIDTLPFFQKYALTLTDITAGVPTLPARFVWDFQEPPTDSWTEQADDDSVWLEQSTVTDIWTEVTAPTDTWTDATDPTDTWSDAA